MKIARAIGKCSMVCGFASVLAFTAIACGGANDSEFGNGSGNNPNGVNGGSAGNGNQGNTSFGNPGGGVDSKCASSTAKAELVPVYLVFMIDRSGSMSQQSKWTTVTAGLDTFFSDSKSSGLFASVAFFKNDQNECDPAAYAKPAVAMTALPGASFQAAIGTYSPNGGTPTLPALKGALQYATLQQAANPGTKVAVVLATDGIPNDCNSTVDNVAAAAAASAGTIPTYVIGVGDQIGNLDAIAAGGGTGKPFLVSVANPQQTATDFQTALDTIRGKSLSCEFKLPAPPQGEVLDINKVNVVYTPSGGQGQTLAYDKDCSGAGGWHYDNPSTPTTIVLCQSTCTTVQAQQGAQIDIVTGCATNGGVQK